MGELSLDLDWTRLRGGGLGHDASLHALAASRRRTVGGPLEAGAVLAGDSGIAGDVLGVDEYQTQPGARRE